MIRKYLLAGLLTLLPLVVTLWLLKAIFSSLIGIFRGPFTWISQALNLPLPPTWMLAIISAVATLVLLVGVGMLMGNLLGRQLLAWLDEIMLLIPGVKGIYGATKQVIGAIQSGQGGSFKEGCWWSGPTRDPIPWAFLPAAIAAGPYRTARPWWPSTSPPPPIPPPATW